MIYCGSPLPLDSVAVAVCLDDNAELLIDAIDDGRINRARAGLTKAAAILILRIRADLAAEIGPK